MLQAIARLDEERLRRLARESSRMADVAALAHWLKDTLPDATPE